MTTNRQGKRYGVYALAIVALVFAGVMLVLGHASFAIRSVGLAGLLLSLYLVRLSNVHAPTAPGLYRPYQTNPPGRLMKRFGVALIPVLGLSGFLLDEDARRGGNQGWPVYLFAAVVFICAGVWGAIAANLNQ